MKKTVIIGLTSLLLMACSVYAPQTAQEFRQSGSESKSFYMKESLTINRSAGDITNTLRDRSKQCLNEQGVVREGYVRDTVGVTRHASTQNIIYTSVLNSTRKGAELIVRSALSGDHYVQLAKVPEGGSYVSIIDVTSIDKTHSKVDIYYHTRLPTLFAGMKGWVTGTDLKCPELHKDYS